MERLGAGATVVVKLGGATLGGTTFDGGGALLEEVAALSRAGLRVVLVHGGGPLITAWLERLGVPTRFMEGQRVTDEPALEVATMVLRGTVNTGIVAALGRLGVRAAGLSGADDRLLRARRRPELGLVGEVAGVDTALLRTLLGQGIVPVVAPLGLDADGTLVNINADVAAAAIAAALAAGAALFLTDVPGVRGADGTVQAQLDADTARRLIADGTISGGMIPKVQACLAALTGARRAMILDGRAPGALQHLLAGTVLGTVVHGYNGSDDDGGHDMTSTAPATGDANAPLVSESDDTLGGVAVHHQSTHTAPVGLTPQEREARAYMRTFKREPLVLVRGEGTRVWDDAGRCYLDLVAGIAVNILGHAHPAVADAISRQAHTLMHTSNLYYSLPQLELAELLIEATGMEGVFFTNSGAEANEAAIKMARKWGQRHKGGAYEIVTALNSFHGRTLATVAATGQPKYQKPFAPMPAGFAHVPYNSIEALEDVVGPGTAAVLLEPIQGEGGIHPAAPGYLAAVRRLCDERDCLLMLDEVQSGMGRTGTFLACQGPEGEEVVPDVVTLAKGLGGGVPLGAALARGSANIFEPGDHGSTQGGNPLSCAAGAATMRALHDEGLMARAVEVGAYVMEGLNGLMARGLPITEVRGRGLMLAIELDGDAPAAVARAREAGVLINATGPTTLRLVPPLVLTRAEADEALDVLAKVLVG